MSGISYTGELTCALEVKDRKRASEWYQQKLGFTFLYDSPDVGWCELSSPVAKVNVGFSEVEKPEVKGGATMTFGVRDIETERSRLEKSGVKFDGPIITIPGLVKLTTLFDADGHKLMLFQGLM